MISGILKRKHEEGPSSHLSIPPSDDEVSCSDSGNSSDSLNHPVPSGLLDSSLQQKSKRFRGRNVHFENVTVYYFSRRQGFTSVPTQGGSTLGMSPRHSSVKSFTLREFALEQKRSHRNMLRHHLKEEKLNQIRMKLTKNGTVSSVEADTLTLDDISEDDLDVDNTEVDEYFFLQPLTTRRRRALLRSSGVRRIEVDEKHELRSLRMSREECGCRCRGICDPETCACSLAGIKCQVDRMSFPCGCTKDGCSNSTGRLEFNPVRVRTHFLHTIMKLELEKSREEQTHQPPHHHQQQPEHQQQQPLVTNGNGFHSNPSPLVQQQQQQQPNLQFPLMMHLPNTTADPHLDEEEEEEEEEEEDEEEEDEAYDDDEDGSSVCSGLSDCSTHSLDTNDPDEGEDSEEEEEEEDDEGEEDDDDWDCPVQSTNPPPYPVPLPSMLGYSNNALISHPFQYSRDSDRPPTLPAVDAALNADIAAQHHGVPCRLPARTLDPQNLSHAQTRESDAAPSGEHSTLLLKDPDWHDSQSESVAMEQTEQEAGETLKDTNPNTA
uniref:Cysteine/serine-rich nuclear protein N-terminal domain-containing protein n=1 Tax=Neogobius melanostomus TaxID=47308 RepID=A0A8C6THE9_9GOBI